MLAFGLFAELFFVESPEGLRFKALNLFTHEPFEFIAQFLDATAIHKRWGPDSCSANHRVPSGCDWIGMLRRYAIAHSNTLGTLL